MTLCAFAMVVILTVIALQMLDMAVPAALLTVMHMQTIALSLGLACLLGYAALRERSGEGITPARRETDA